MGNIFGYVYGYFFRQRKQHPEGPCDKLHCPRNPAGCKLILDLIRQAGYDAESHSVTTDDGYILSLQRVRRKTPTAAAKRIVFLQHGLCDAAATWIVNGKNSLSTVLAENDCDVWLGNTRGNTFSRCHVTFDADRDDDDYWKWSWDEMQQYDIPAMVHYVLQRTQQNHIYYVGHSQGTLIGFASFSTNLQLASQVKMFFALAPVSTVSHIKGVAKEMAETAQLVPVFELLGEREIAGNNQVLDDIGRFIGSTSVGEELMEQVVFKVAGPNDDTISDKYPFSTTLEYFPAGTSAQNLSHYCKMYSSGKMESYDKKITYDLRGMKVNTILYYGTNDYLADEKDVQDGLLSKLTNCKVNRMDGWNHSDFVWNSYKAQQIYEEIAREIEITETASPA